MVSLCFVLVSLIVGASCQSLGFGDSGGRDLGLRKCPSGEFVSSFRISTLHFNGVNFIVGLRLICGKGSTTLVFNGARTGMLGRARTDVSVAKCDRGASDVKVGYVSTTLVHSVDGLRIRCRGDTAFQGSPTIGKRQLKSCNAGRKICGAKVFVNPLGDFRKIRFECCKV